MPSEYSFDMVSKVDLQEIQNAVNQVNKEISTRYDFRGSVSKVEADLKAPSLTLFSDDENKLKSVVDILQNKCIKRNVSLKSLDYQKVDPAEKGTVRQTVKIKEGIPTDKAKEIVKGLKATKLKVTPSIQSDQVRVTSKSKDELQSTMDWVRSQNFDLDIQFTNYR